jgi:hypothetical protein
MGCNSTYRTGAYKEDDVEMYVIVPQSKRGETKKMDTTTRGRCAEAESGTSLYSMVFVAAPKLGKLCIHHTVYTVYLVEVDYIE